MQRVGPFIKPYHTLIQVNDLLITFFIFPRHLLPRLETKQIHKYSALVAVFKCLDLKYDFLDTLQ